MLSPARTGLVLLLLFVLAAAFLWKVVLLGRVLVPADVLLVMTPWKFYARERFPEFRQAQNGLLDPVQQYYPWRHHATGSLKEGVIPLWNPYMFCGTPFVANQQSTVFYPPNLLFLLTSVAKGFGVSTLLHLTLLGWGTFLFLRELGLRRGAAMVGAIAFMFNGYVVAWLEFPAFSIWVATWLPWTLWLFERAWQSAVGSRQSAVGSRPSAIRNPQSAIRNPGLWVGLCGVVWGLQFLGGQLQVSFYLLITFGSYGLFRILTSRSPPHHLTTSPLTPRWPKAIALYLLLPVILGGLLAGAHLGPSLELVPYTERGERISWEFIGQFALPPWQLITLILPNFFGNSAFHNLYWGHFNFIEMCGYVGVTTLLLALFAAGFPAPPERRRPVWFFLGLAIFSLLIATATPLYLIFYYLVPGFKQLAGAARILLLNAFALATLAAFGVDFLLDPPGIPPLPPLRKGGRIGSAATDASRCAFCRFWWWSRCWRRWFGRLCASPARNNSISSTRRNSCRAFRSSPTN